MPHHRLYETEEGVGLQRPLLAVAGGWNLVQGWLIWRRGMKRKKGGAGRRGQNCPSECFHGHEDCPNLETEERGKNKINKLDPVAMWLPGVLTWHVHYFLFRAQNDS